MRYLFLIAGAVVLALDVSPAQNTGSTGGGGMQQVPVGQVFRNFTFPEYENGKLKSTLSATQATGITQNRAETINLVIKLYDNGAPKPTTTITSPKADLLLADRQMRTKSTVLIVRSDMEASSQTCDFDLVTKKYTLRTNVRVVLKNFDAGKSTMSPTATAKPTAPAPPPAPKPPVDNGASILDSPGAVSNPDYSPLPKPAKDSK